MPGGLTNSDGIPALERLMQFTAARHRVILNNIANLSTPGFRPSDVSPQAFQAQLAEALDESRKPATAVGWASPTAERPQTLGVDSQQAPLIVGGQCPPYGADSALPLRSTREVEAMPDRLTLHPQATGDNILFHDGSDHSVERVMQALVENFMAYRTAAQLMRNRIDIINTAIRERV
jgi:flagellar basal body rod protein FlgB